MPRTSLPQEVSAEIKAGNVLAGDDFDETQLRRWYEQEKEAYFLDDATSGRQDPWYAYMRYVNDRLVFPRVAARSGSILFLGTGDGVEAETFHQAHPDWNLLFVEASDSFKTELALRFPRARVVEPHPSGDLAVESESQDVICAFSVLHHIANVSHVLGELYRLTTPGGWLFIREPCSSMGDWRGSRSATPNERGISRHLLTRMAAEAGFVTAAPPRPVVFGPLNKVLKRTIGFRFVPMPVLYLVDRALSSAVALNDQYWRDAWYKKVGPSSYLYSFRRPTPSTPHGAP
jgi:2-polyprenyl-3-methyl-5-hydroxy-6-metoxy-1,4-benzoquinol methylase